MPRSKIRTKKSIPVARALRQSLSLPETLLWREIKARHSKYKVRRQLRLDPYVVDFYVPEIQLAIEVDGDQHRASKEYDEARDVSLTQKGICILRMAARDVLGSPEGCALWIEAACDEVAAWRKGDDGTPARSEQGVRYPR